MEIKKYFKYILFFTTLILGDILIGTLLSDFSKKRKHDKRIELILQNKIQSDIIILGSSLALNDYSPEVISKITGTSCYNLGMSGSNPVFHETMLDLILLGTQKPRLIIYNVDEFAALYFKKGVLFRTDVLYPYVDNKIINEIVCREMKRSLLATNVSSAYRENVNFVNVINYLFKGKEKVDYRMNNVNEFGATLIDARPDDKPVELMKKQIDLNDFSIHSPYKQSIINIQEKCLKNGIQLLFCLPPQFASPIEGFVEKVKTITDARVPILDFSGQLDSTHYFFDSEHLNRTGATRFSELLSEEILKYYVNGI